MRRILCVSIVVLLSGLFFAPIARAEDQWQRIVLVEDPRIVVTLLLKRPATPADEEFVGFELNNRTDKPLRIANAHYRLDGVTVSTLGPQRKPLRTQSLASGNDYDLLWRNGARPPENAHRDDSIPPGITRRLRHASITSFSLLGIPPAPGWQVEGHAPLTIGLNGLPAGDDFATPRGGVPFRFDWLPPDKAGIDALRQRLLRTLGEPGDPFGDAYLLGALLKDDRVGSGATVGDLLAAFKRHDTVVRPTLREYLDAKYADDDQVITFMLNDVIAARNARLLGDLWPAERIRDPRLIDPLVRWVEEDREPYDASRPAMIILARHRGLMQNPDVIASTLGRATLQRAQFFVNRGFPKDETWRWAHELHDLVLTGDATLIPHIKPFLSRTEVTQNARLSSTPNNGIDTRVCDEAYNAILDLLQRRGERLSMSSGFEKPRPDVRDEYIRRDALIAKLKAELNNE